LLTKAGFGGIYACELMSWICVLNFCWFDPSDFLGSLGGFVCVTMETEQVLSSSVAFRVEDILQQHGARFSDRGLASMKAGEACMIQSFLKFFLHSLF
jgi:hypothetical protein